MTKISRRNFIKLGLVGSATAAVLSGCKWPKRWVILEPYVKPPEEQLAGQATWYASTCRMCPAGCGIIVRVMNGRALKIEGNPLHPLNQGKLCARGQAGVQLLYDPDRLNGPVAQATRGSRQFQSISWNKAINTLYSKLQDAGSNVAVWLDSTTSGHLYDLFSRFTKAIGAPDPLVSDLYTEINAYSASANAGEALFGQRGLPVYDIANADVVFSFGANFAGPEQSQVRYGVNYGKFRSQPHGKRGYLVQFEPRMTITGVKADKWYGIKPGSEGVIALGIARLIADLKLGPADMVQRAQALAANVDINGVAAASDVPVAELTRLARVFASASRPLAIPGNAAAGQANSDTVLMEIQTLNLIAGTAGQLGGVSLSTTTPPAGLVKPPVAPFSSVLDLIKNRLANGSVKVLLLHGVNPVFDLPSVSGFQHGFNAPFVVSFNPLVDESSVWADLIMPDRTYLEAWGYEVVSPDFGTPIVSGQQPVVTPVFDSRATADILLTVARGLPAAAKAMPWSDEASYLKQVIGQLPPGAAGGSGPDVLWSRFQQNGGWWPASPAPQALKPVIPSQPVQVVEPQFQGSANDYPYFLHLYLSDFLSDGRGAFSQWLQGSPDTMTNISWQTWVEMHPDTATKLGVQNGDIVQVTSQYGLLEAPAFIYQGIRPDTIAIPIGQGHTDYGRNARARGANPIDLIGISADTSGNSLVWSNQRVKVARTGKHQELALMNATTPETSFINQGYPGQ
jgi:anaerobic selenocysteine-containing dehydrogenase